MRREIDHHVRGATPKRFAPVAQQADEQRHGPRTDPPDDVEDDLVHLVPLESEKTAQHRQRAASAGRQCGFRSGADLRVLVEQAVRPFELRDGSGSRPLRRRLGQRHLLAEGGSKHQRESTRRG
jgi:hypothetical protein